ncbi:hypothetical protein Poli38472_001688 [Pythium oligandrum]|uniref:Tubulin-specific chaperone A n=1 Tax=Pythium oligandrum TaxID=41045 RepID=A0A8K1CTA9_PYTOL|nr:hypothetical protein Poli38472_001688 [Pythium oligandrum]|eukprot:TMW69532.1 hypothetical protein Poli38472_001688 [Pythium oligandrum]
MAERQFKIKVGSLRRVKKDLEYYAKELTQQKLKIEKMRQDGKDEYDIKKQEEVLVETETMLPDCQMRLQETVNDVTKFMTAHQSEVEALTALHEEATTLLEAAKTLLQ